MCWLLGDHLDRTAYTVNDTTETRYFPCGKDRFTSGATLTSYKFTGQREEAGLGLYYYGARWYDRSTELTPKSGAGALYPAGYPRAQSGGCAEF